MNELWDFIKDHPFVGYILAALGVLRFLRGTEADVRWVVDRARTFFDWYADGGEPDSGGVVIEVPVGRLQMTAHRAHIEGNITMTMTPNARMEFRAARSGDSE